ncbi:MAG: hypothetical protein ACKVOR_12190 [Flavobacteriales bacterium]
MNKDAINSLIQNQQSQLLVDPLELENIARQFPYFSAAQMLLSKTYKQQKHFGYTNQVSKAALYAGNRAALYHWLKDEQSLRVESEIVIEGITELSESLVIQSKQERDDTAQPIEPVEASLATQQVIWLAADILLDESKDASEEKKPPHITSSQEQIATAGEIDSIGSIKPQLDDLQREILLEAMQSSIELEVGEVQDDIVPLQVAAVEGSDEQLNDDELTQASPYARWMLMRSRQIHFAEQIAIPPESTTPPASADWLRGGHGQEIENDAETDEAATHERLRRKHNQRIQVPDARENHRNLIDRFIQIEPRITRNRSVDYPTGNMARESLEEDLELVTETMAKLYALQGKPDKARRAYKKLIELHPEKSIYFAAQLKNLDKLKKP